MLLAEVNYLCGVSPGVGERDASAEAWNNSWILKSSPLESHIHSPLAPFTTRSETVPKTSEEEHEIDLFDPALGLNETPQVLLYWKRRRQADGLQDSCVDTFHLSHWSENRLLTCLVFSPACPIEITGLWLYKQPSNVLTSASCWKIAFKRQMLPPDKKKIYIVFKKHFLLNWLEVKLKWNLKTRKLKANKKY